LLIIECDSANLAADRLNLGKALADLLEHHAVKLLLRDSKVRLVQTATGDRLLEQFRQVAEEHGHFRAILVVAHSNPVGLQLTSDKFCAWRAFGKWLQPFEPEFVFLVACEAGGSETVRELFEPVKKTLRDVYASPAKLYGIQAAALAVIIGELLLTGDIDDEHSVAARLVNYIGTGGQVYRWSYEETGLGAEIPAKSWDDLAKAFDFGEWNLQQRIDEWIQSVHRNS
jgi:hypothetical protein